VNQLHFHNRYDFDNTVVLLKSNIDIQETHLWTPEAGLLNKSSCIAQTFGVAKFLNSSKIFWSLFVVLLKSDLSKRTKCDPIHNTDFHYCGQT
jgi:hypothetical protein